LPSDDYNLVDKTLSVLEIADVLKEIYPSLEMVFVNQHLKMREIKVERDERINQLLHKKAPSLLEELKAYKKVFAF
jgi:UDP-glucose 4-epimerase